MNSSDVKVPIMAEEESHGLQNVFRHKTPTPFQPLVVLEFAAGAKQPAIEWMISKLQMPETAGGADLEVSAVVMTYKQVSQKQTVLYVGAKASRLLTAADMMGLSKMYKDGRHREFSIEDMDNFKGIEDPESFLTTAEKQKLILHEIEAVRAGEEEDHIPGYDKITLWTGKSILKKYLSRDIITKMYPLHEPEELKKLGADWYQLSRVFKEQPIDDIRHYFGEKIGLYFAFLGYYTIALIPPAFIGIIYFITSWQSMYREAIFAVFNLIWATIFLEVWKRYCSELSYRWGTIDMVSSRYDEPRANYYGTLGENPVTGKPEPVYPKWKRNVRFYCVTVPVISLALAIAFYLMLVYFAMEDWALKMYSSEKSWLNFLVLHVPTAIYAIVIVVLNALYRKLAKKLNDWENHRLQSAYDNHLIVKLILFDFVNCFISLFYVAFYLQDMVLLRSHLAGLLITQQVIGQIQEAMVPFVFLKRRKKQVDNLMKKQDALQKVEYFNGEIDEEVQKQAGVESEMEEYLGTMDDYLEMFLQFGYVFLFSSAFPLAALWAFLNNITEIRSDAFKMVRVFQRPFAESASSIGAWQVAFELISIMAVMTNCALIGMNPEVKKLLPTDITPVNIVLIFVAVEHIILAIKVAVAILIPDQPHWVEIELAKTAYQSKLALQEKHLHKSPADKEKIDAVLKGKKQS
ncbi:anoctamin-10-like isoform X1 [Saccostrea cucullata]|uniref:anoctamin-10-like isoform X1 n=2 Tax=Saccostrea cuccullata TaxID=36930 RepID=UPI002ED14168